MDNETMVAVTPEDRRAACKYYGYDDEKELAYWGNVSSHGDVERLAKAFARYRHQSGRTGDREGVENVGCNYCGAQVALMGADYLEQLADALDKVGAPRKSPDGNEHYGLEKRIAALGEGRTGAGEALLKRARVQIELGRATGNHTGNPRNIYQIAEELLAALSQSTAGEDGV